MLLNVCTPPPIALRSECGDGMTFDNNISTMQTEAQRGRAISTWDVNTVDTSISNKKN